MKRQLDPLIRLISEKPRMPLLRRELADQFSGWSPERIANECIDGLHQWLSMTCVVYFQISPTQCDDVKSLAREKPFALTIQYLESLVDIWSISKPPPEQWICIQTVVDLLLVLVAKQELPCSVVEDELIASFFLIAALWNGRLGRPLLESAGDEVFVNSDLYTLLVSKTRLDELVDDTRRRFRLDD